MRVTDEIKSRLDIVDLISETVSLRRSGRNYAGFCPFHHNTRIAFTAGELIPSQIYYKAQKLRALVRKQTLDALERYDVLAMPIDSEPATIMDMRPGVRSKEAAIQALRRGSYRGLFSMVSGPALSVCCGFTSDGEGKLPLALQLAGRPFDEATVLNVAHAYQQNTAWHLERPPTSIPRAVDWDTCSSAPTAIARMVPGCQVCSRRLRATRY